MIEPIRGKVARILNLRDLALNIGSSSGVQMGMLFDVMDPKGENITDPDSGSVLGSIERPKVRVRITQVQEKLSVASTYRKKEINVGGTLDLGNFGAMATLLMPPKWITEHETLKTNEQTWDDLNENESFVKTGDPVVQVIEETNNEKPTMSGNVKD